MKRRFTPGAIALLALLLSSSCTQQADAPFDLSAARAIIEQKNAEFTAAHVAGDVATIDAMFTRDARSFPPGSEAAIGPAALHTLTVEYLKSGIKAFREQTTDLYGTSELLIDQGEYTVIYGRDSTVERGKYLNVWKQEDGEWKIDANMWNTNAPAPASADEAAALAVADSSLVAISRSDFVAFTDLMLDSAVTFSAGMRNGQYQVQFRTRAQQRAIRTTSRFTERGYHPTVLVSGPVAMVWLPYDFYQDGKWSHCGVDLFTLLKTDKGWRIATLVWSAEQPPSCARHPDGPPPGAQP